MPGITTCAVKVLDAAVAEGLRGQAQDPLVRRPRRRRGPRACTIPQVKDEQVGTLSEDEQRQLYLPDDTLKAFEYYSLGLKGPLTTPIGGGFRSINVYLRIRFDLYACVRPVRYFKGVEAPNKRADKVNMVIFRENTEDVYCGIEFKSGSDKAKKRHRPAQGDGLQRRAVGGHRHQADQPGGQQAAGPHGHPLRHRQEAAQRDADAQGQHHEVHRGGVQGLGLRAGQATEFRDQIVTEDEVYKGADGKGKVVIKDRIADSMFQQIQLRPDEYSVIATPNLNGDYISDAAAAMTGGIGLAAGANIGDQAAMFEATHGTAPKYTGKNMANPGAVLLSGVLMLEHMGWDEAAKLVNTGLEATFAESEETAKQGPGRQAVRHLRHRPAVRRLRRRGRGDQCGVCGADYSSPGKPVTRDLFRLFPHRNGEWK